MLKAFALLLLVLSQYFSAIGQSLAMVDRPIVFDEERIALTRAYLKAHYDIEAEEPTIVPRMIVVHWTAYNTLEKSFQAFYPATLADTRPNIAQASRLNVSVPYLIDRDGTIYQLMPDTIMARHVIGLNHCAIGIENVGSQSAPLTEAQLQANARLINHLTAQYAIEYLIGHHEYRQFIGHKLWKETDPAYLTEKDDPGEEFMKQLRQLLPEPLQGPP